MSRVAVGDTRLHRAVFDDDVDTLHQLLQALPPTTTTTTTTNTINENTTGINARDARGNTPLHLAVLLNREHMIAPLLTAGARGGARNALGYSAFEEAISMGQRSVVAPLWKTMKRQLVASVEAKGAALVADLARIPDFSMKVAWNFSSWMPFVRQREECSLFVALFVFSLSFVIHSNSFYFFLLTSFAPFVFAM
jgi:hypothetical protein